MCCVDFGDDRFACVCREIALGHVHLVFHVKDGLVDVGRQLKFQDKLAGAFGAIAAERLEAFERLDFLFDRFDQEALGIFRRDAGKRHRDADKGNRDIGVSFLRQADIGDRAGNDRAHENGKHHAGPANSAIDQTVHCTAPPAGTGFTFTPSLR